MASYLVRLLRASGVPSGKADTWLLAPSPFQDRNSLGGHTVRGQFALDGGRKQECYNQTSDRTRDRDKSLARILRPQGCLKAPIRYAWSASYCRTVPPS